MLMEKASVDIDQDPPSTATAPVTAGAVFAAGKPEIHVPVYPLSPPSIFAPPFLIPIGVWTVVLELQSPPPPFPPLPPDLVFLDVQYKDRPKGPEIKSDDTPGKTTWTTTFDMNKVTGPNRMRCEIRLGRFSNGVPTYSGDPTIAVVQDPMGG